MKAVRKIKSSLKSKTSGFTLIETLVAITVLLISILAPLQIASTALFSAFYSRDEITAYYLAAEAIEYVRNVRDSTDLTGIELVKNNPSLPRPYWLTDLNSCNTVFSSNGCKIETSKGYSNGAITPCPTEGCERLRFNESSGIWGYTSSDPVSRFTRNIVLIPQTNHGLDGEARIEVTVEWQSSSSFGGEKKVKLNGYMADWQDR